MGGIPGGIGGGTGGLPGGVGGLTGGLGGGAGGLPGGVGGLPGGVGGFTGGLGGGASAISGGLPGGVGGITGGIGGGASGLPGGLGGGATGGIGGGIAGINARVAGLTVESSGEDEEDVEDFAATFLSALKLVQGNDEEMRNDDLTVENERQEQFESSEQSEELAPMFVKSRPYFSPRVKEKFLEKLKTEIGNSRRQTQQSSRVTESEKLQKPRPSAPRKVVVHRVVPSVS